MNSPRKIAVVTGSRADYGLLRPVMRAIRGHGDLQLQVLVTGTHLLREMGSIEEVASEFEIAGRIVMQQEGHSGRLADAMALGRGVLGFAEQFEADCPDVVLVLGDRIEAFAAASAAAIGGIRVAHMHGGDRAVGIADDAMRHAISKLAHLHLAASANSVERLLNMGELPLHVHLVGSPALDDLASIGALDDEMYSALGSPEIVFLLHPTGQSVEAEYDHARRLLEVCNGVTSPGRRVLVIYPNHDAGREGIVRAIEEDDASVARVHLNREQFVGVCRRAKAIVGNSSAGLIECAAIGLSAVNIGQRQRGRDMPATVRNIPMWDFEVIEMALREILESSRPMGARHPYGDGTAGIKTAEILASFDPEQYPLTKRNSY